MNIFGWIFLITSWSIIITLLVYCGYRIILKP
jgi:hypothetical protein